MRITTGGQPPGLSATASYIRRSYDNLVVVDNTLVAPSDYSSFCVTTPTDARLPGGGGTPICGFYDINPNKFGQQFNRTLHAKKVGDLIDVYDGFDLTMSMRLPNGIQGQGGINVGRELLDTCDTAGKIDNVAGLVQANVGRGANPSQNASPSTLFCRITPPFLPQVKFLAVVPLKWGITTSVTLQSLPGPEILGNYAVSNAQIASTLGRNLSGGRTVTSVNIIEPGTMYGDRLNQIDFRASKVVRFGRMRLNANVDIFNVMNANAVVRQNNTYGAAWQRPQFIMLGRFLKLGAQLNF